MKKLLLCIMVFCSLIMFSQDEKATDSIKKPFQLSGSLTLFASVYEANGIEARRKSFSWFLSGSPILK